MKKKNSPQRRGDAKMFVVFSAEAEIYLSKVES
jgi:hypothetical protein